MRRHHNTNRGGNGRGSSNMSTSGSSNTFRGRSPTDPIKDMNLELDWLKHKREMLEQEQQLMIQPQMPPQINFSHEPFYQFEPTQSGSNRDYPQTFTYGSQEYPTAFGKQRPPANHWKRRFYHKRSTGRGKRGPSYSNTESTHVWDQRHGQNQYSKQSVGQKIVNQRQERPAKNDMANRGTKPTEAYVPPNKLAAQPIADRNNLMEAAIKSVAEVEARPWEALRLHPDKESTNQLNGPLELALGAILKDIQDKCAESSHHALLRTNKIQRVIKQAIRQRIRTAMFGKIVGTTQDTIDEYRAMYPINTDIEIVDIALEAGGVRPKNNPQPIDMEKNTPEAFFKRSFFKVVDYHLNEMFGKLEEIYSAPQTEGETSQQVTAELFPYANEYKLMFSKLLKRHIPTIVNLFYQNERNMDPVRDIAATRNMVEEYSNKELEFIADNSDIVQAPRKGQFHDVLPYFVRLMGVPKLPSMHLIQSFLDAFHPEFIKKHKTIHNLLFIGFSNKNNYLGLKAADGTVIDNNILCIRVQKEAQSDDAKQEATATATDLLGTVLDEQLTDLN